MVAVTLTWFCMAECDVTGDQLTAGEVGHGDVRLRLKADVAALGPAQGEHQVSLGLIGVHGICQRQDT